MEVRKLLTNAPESPPQQRCPSQGVDNAETESLWFRRNSYPKVKLSMWPNLGWGVGVQLIVHAENIGFIDFIFKIKNVPICVSVILAKVISSLKSKLPSQLFKLFLFTFPFLYIM